MFTASKKSFRWHLGMALCLVSIGGTSALGAEKVVDTVLLKHDPSPTGVYRWSEAALLNMDGKDHLMMLVSAFGHGGHDHTAADILEFHSRDGGVTWTPLAEAKVFQANIGNQNVMSPSLLRIDNGDILFFFMVKNAPLEDTGPWMRRSTDNGASWSEPVRLPYDGYGGMAPNRAVQLSTGRILLPCWMSKDRLGSTHAYSMWSDDRGKTWKKSELITTPKGSTGRKTNPAAEEPTVIELKDGRVLIFMRTYLKSIYQSASRDGGETWSEPVSSGIPSPGCMATLERLPDGNILLIWNSAPVEKIDGPWPRTLFASAVSTDDGKNFSNVRTLDGSADFSGPKDEPKITMATVAFVKNRAVIVYSKSMSPKNAYNWRLQVVPIAWFYGGDATQVYGQGYLPTLQEKLKQK